MAASVDKMVADQGTVGARLPQGAPNRAQSEKAENALARRIALQDKFATGVLFAIVAAICVLLFSLIAYIVASGAGKLLDVSFLTGKPRAIQGRRRHWPRAVQLVLFAGAHFAYFGAYRAWRRDLPY